MSEESKKLVTSDGVEVTPGTMVWKFYYASCRTGAEPANRPGIVSNRYSTKEACLKETLELLDQDLEDARQEYEKQKEYRDRVADLLKGE